jgi:hypothetical protein
MANFSCKFAQMISIEIYPEKLQRSLGFWFKVAGRNQEFAVRIVDFQWMRIKDSEYPDRAQDGDRIDPPSRQPRRADEPAWKCRKNGF